MKNLTFLARYPFAFYKRKPHMALCFAQSHDIEVFTQANSNLPKEKQIDITFFPQITSLNLVKSFQGKGFDTICGFVNDDFSKPVLKECKKLGIDTVALRCAGFNNCDLKAAKELGIKVCRVPAYSPQGVAEHGISLLCALNRNIHRAYWRMLGQNYKIEGLMGMQLYKKTISIIGCGKVGQCMARICNGFGMKVQIWDVVKQDPKFLKEVNGIEVGREQALKTADIITLHTPLVPETTHLINKKTIAMTKKGVIIINVGRGPLVNTADLIEGIKSKHIGGYCADVMEGEADYYFVDHSTNIVLND